jgi:hypothetical protein
MGASLLEFSGLLSFSSTCVGKRMEKRLIRQLIVLSVLQTLAMAPFSKCNSQTRQRPKSDAAAVQVHTN